MIFILVTAFVILLFQIVKCIFDEFDFDNFVVGVLALCIMAWILRDMICHDTPQAIDVYRGNTTLEITYKDGVPVDTVVVFK